MSKCRVEFTLSMPNVNSWNGRWSGEGKNYIIVRNVDAATVSNWGTMYWHHSFGDGWAAGVTARVMEPGERKKKSAGFYGYDWMVANIIRWGTTRCQCDFRPLPEGHTYGDGEWERCGYCGTVKQIRAAIAKATGEETCQRK